MSGSLRKTRRDSTNQGEHLGSLTGHRLIKTALTRIAHAGVTFNDKKKQSVRVPIIDRHIVNQFKVRQPESRHKCAKIGKTQRFGEATYQGLGGGLSCSGQS